MADANNPFISVIIPSYNAYRTIGRTITEIKKQRSGGMLLEIIVVDSSDDEQTKTLLNSFEGDGLRVITSGIRVMPAIQRNIGARAAKGKLLVFIDSDAYPDPDWLQKISEAYSKGYRVGGGSYLVPEEQLKNKQIVAQYYFEFGEYIPAGRIRKKKMAPTCNLFCDRELFFEAGEIPVIRASEDTLFGLNVNKISPLYFFPEIKVYHVFREDPKHALSNQNLIGKFIIIYRRIYYKGIYGSKISLLVLYPMIICYKFFNVYLRNLFPEPRHFLKLNTVLFKFIQCTWYWAGGAFQGIFYDVINDPDNSMPDEIKSVSSSPSVQM
ncbi:MAG: hypothetical protein CSA96_06715 [Bacteroidetes bacterium]|nr:MAG: hypothetical protein CSA96_06715 [Bacteroidota bacterium]